MFASVDPSTNERIATHELHSAAEVERRLARADGIWRAWSVLPVEERASRLGAMADLLDTRAGEYGELITAEMGKPISQAEAEIKKCAWVCRHYADAAPDYLAPQEIATDAVASYVRYDPLGPLLAIMPWNFPFWQVFRFLVPAAAAGNVVLLKHAETTMGCAEAIETLARDAGLPDGVLQLLRVSRAVVPAVIGDPRVRGVTLTGSVRAGRAVGKAAGAAMKPSVLELGGSDPFIVLEDADVEAAARAGAAARLLNSGQSCICAKRFLVHERVAASFEEALAAEFAKARVGDPRDPATTVGPLARADLRDELEGQVRRSLEQGGRLVTGGQRGQEPGFFYEPTILADLPDGVPALAEETFGPVAAIAPFDDHEAALSAANDSRYGLGASVWSRDPQRGRRLAARLEAGAVSINDIVKSDPRLPFGGIKESGYGRELGAEGIRAFTNVKSVWVGQ